MACDVTVGNLPGISDYIVGSLMALLATSAVLENMTILIIFLMKIDFVKPSFKIMRSMNVADLMTGLLLDTIIVVQYFDGGEYLDKCTTEYFQRYLVAVLTISSGFTLGFISYDRYTHLILRHEYKMPGKTINIFLGISWLSSLLVPLLIFIDRSERFYANFMFTTCIILLLIFSLSFVALLRAINTHKDIMQIRTWAAIRERKEAATVVIVISLFSLTMLPYILYQGLIASRYDAETLVLLYNAALVLMVVKSSINPWIFFVRNVTIRRYVYELFNMHQSIQRRTERRHSSATRQRLGSRSNTEMIITGDVSEEASNKTKRSASVLSKMYQVSSKKQDSLRR